MTINSVNITAIASRLMLSMPSEPIARFYFQAVGYKAKEAIAQQLGYPKGKALPTYEGTYATIAKVGNTTLLYEATKGFLVEEGSVSDMVKYVTSKFPGSTIEKKGTVAYYVKNWTLT